MELIYRPANSLQTPRTKSHGGFGHSGLVALQVKHQGIHVSTGQSAYQFRIPVGLFGIANLRGSGFRLGNSFVSLFFFLKNNDSCYCTNGGCLQIGRPTKRVVPFGFLNKHLTHKVHGAAQSDIHQGLERYHLVWPFFSAGPACELPDSPPGPSFPAAADVAIGAEDQGRSFCKSVIPLHLLTYPIFLTIYPSIYLSTNLSSYC